MSIRILVKQALLTTQIHAKSGQMLAEVLKKSRLPNGDFGQCGFNLECGTCVIKADSNMGEMGIEEEMVLKSLGKSKPYRCSCQITITESMNNSVIELP